MSLLTTLTLFLLVGGVVTLSRYYDRDYPLSRYYDRRYPDRRESYNRRHYDSRQCEYRYDSRGNRIYYDRSCKNDEMGRYNNDYYGSGWRRRPDSIGREVYVASDGRKTFLGRGSMRTSRNDAILICEFPRDRVVSNIIWERSMGRDNHKLRYGRDYYTNDFNGGSELVIRDFDRNDFGLYRCVATAETSVSRTRVTLQQVYMEIDFYDP